MKLCFVGGCFLYHLEGRAGMSPEEFVVTVVSVDVRGVWECVCVNLASGKSRSQVAGIQTWWVQLGCSGSLTGFLLCTWWLNHATLRPMGFPWRWDLVLEHQAALCSSE